MDLMMNTFRNNFGNLALLTELLGPPNNQLTLDPLLNDFGQVNKTVSHIINIFRNLFGDPTGNIRLSPLDLLSRLNDRIRRSLGCLFNMGLPNIPNLSNITDSIQRNISSILTGFLQKDILLPRLSLLRLLFRIPSIQMNNNIPTLPQSAALTLPTIDPQLSALIKFLRPRINFNDFLARLGNKRLNIQNGFLPSFPRIWKLPNITGILPNINLMWPANLFRMNPISRIFNWTTPINNLRTLLESVRSIPESIIQFFKTIGETLNPLGIVKENWKTIKTDPLFLAQSCSSKLEGLYQFSRFEPPSRCKRIKSKLCHRKRLSLWNKLKSKLFNHFKC